MEDKYLSIGAICLTVVGLLFQHFAVLAGIKERITALETKMDLFWKAIESNVVQMLKTYPTNIRKDILLDKLSSAELNLDETYELRTIITGEMQTSKNERIAYVLLLASIEQRIYDYKTNNKKSLWTRFLSQ